MYKNNIKRADKAEWIRKRFVSTNIIINHIFYPRETFQNKLK